MKSSGQSFQHHGQFPVVNNWQRVRVKYIRVYANSVTRMGFPAYQLSLTRDAIKLDVYSTIWTVQAPTKVKPSIIDFL